MVALTMATMAYRQLTFFLAFSYVSCYKCFLSSFYFIFCSPLSRCTCWYL